MSLFLDKNWIGQLCDPRFDLLAKVANLIRFRPHLNLNEDTKVIYPQCVEVALKNTNIIQKGTVSEIQILFWSKLGAWIYYNKARCSYSVTCWEHVSYRMDLKPVGKLYENSQSLYQVWFPSSMYAIKVWMRVTHSC